MKMKMKIYNKLLSYTNWKSYKPDNYNNNENKIIILRADSLGYWDDINDILINRNSDTIYFKKDIINTEYSLITVGSYYIIETDFSKVTYMNDKNDKNSEALSLVLIKNKEFENDMSDIIQKTKIYECQISQCLVTSGFLHYKANKVPVLCDNMNPDNTGIAYFEKQFKICINIENVENNLKNDESSYYFEKSYNEEIYITSTSKEINTSQRYIISINSFEYFDYKLYIIDDGYLIGLSVIKVINANPTSHSILLKYDKHSITQATDTTKAYATVKVLRPDTTEHTGNYKDINEKIIW
ncbi:hypothetical protein PIROE2DRAFT_5757 [Piromyces sp. E2]|nr:hypothetical protein PIROE2DRAFT_5757 [Piromyces sp. E2]|eukprot:OUM66896.1 hypothetical protein PIROE2DRAFT_5757 [Piromyces sp. E2]